MVPPKRLFPCGHRGKGQYCHRCQQEKEERARRERELSARRQEREYLENEWELSTEGLPDSIVHRAIELLRDLREGKSFAQLGVKRMEFDRNCLSANLGKDYRLLLKQNEEGNLYPVRIVSHEAYNAPIRNTARKGW